MFSFNALSHYRWSRIPSGALHLVMTFDPCCQWLRSCLPVWQRDPFFTDPPVTI